MKNLSKYNQKTKSIFYESVRRYEYELVLNTLKASAFNISKTSRKLGINRATIYKIIGERKRELTDKYNMQNYKEFYMEELVRI